MQLNFIDSLLIRTNNVADAETKLQAFFQIRKNHYRWNKSKFCSLRPFLNREKSSRLFN